MKKIITDCCVDNGIIHEYSYEYMEPPFKINDIVTYSNDLGIYYGIVRESEEFVHPNLEHYTCISLLEQYDPSKEENIFIATNSLSIVTDQNIINKFNKIKVFS